MPIVDVMTVKVVSVGPEETVQAAIARMLDEEVGAVAVCAGERLVGIFTERDVLRLAGQGAHFEALRVDEVMTPSPVAVPPDTDILVAAHVMSERRIRHLPVVEGGNLLGMIGSRDILRTLLETLWHTHDPEARDTARELLARAPAAQRA